MNLYRTKGDGVAALLVQARSSRQAARITQNFYREQGLAVSWVQVNLYREPEEIGIHYIPMGQEWEYDVTGKNPKRLTLSS